MHGGAAAFALVLIAVAVPLSLSRSLLARSLGQLILGCIVLLCASLPFQILGLFEFGRILRWPLFIAAGVIFVGWLRAPPVRAKARPDADTKTPPPA